MHEVDELGAALRDLEADRSLVHEGLAAVDEATGRGAVLLEPLRLEIRRVRPVDVRSFVPIEPEPAQSIENASDHLVRRALDVGVLDAKNEDAAMAAGIEPVE